MQMKLVMSQLAKIRKGYIYCKTAALVAMLLNVDILNQVIQHASNLFVTLNLTIQP